MILGLRRVIGKRNIENLTDTLLNNQIFKIIFHQKAWFHSSSDELTDITLNRSYIF